MSGRITWTERIYNKHLQPCANISGQAYKMALLGEHLDPNWVLRSSSDPMDPVDPPTPQTIIPFYFSKKRPNYLKFWSAAGAPQAFQGSAALEFSCGQPQRAPSGWVFSGLTHRHNKSGFPKVHAASSWAFFLSFQWSGLKFLRLRRSVPAESETSHIAHHICIILYNQMKNALKINAELRKRHGHQDITELCLFNPNTAEQSV